MNRGDIETESLLKSQKATGQKTYATPLYSRERSALRGGWKRGKGRRQRMSWDIVLLLLNW